MSNTNKEILGVSDVFYCIETDCLRSFKIDTGALTSSMHCIKAHMISDDELYVKFSKSHAEVFNDFEVRTVKSSNGTEEDRFSVTMNISIYGKIYQGEFTLRNRKSMKKKALLGSNFMTKNGFIVDPSVEGLSKYYEKYLHI